MNRYTLMITVGKKISLVLILAFVSLASYAQTSLVTPEISAFYGYGFASRLYTNTGYLRFQDSPIYGGSVAIPVPVKGVGFQVELSYQRQDTKVDSYFGNNYYYPSYPGQSNNNSSWKVALNYFQLGAVYNMIKTPDQRAVPFIGINAGMLYFENNEQGYSDLYKFAYGLKAGAKVRMNDQIGLRLQGSLLAPISGVGMYLGYGSGGASTGVAVTSSVIQFNVSAGLVYYLRKK